MSPQWIVAKFGGSSVKDGSAMLRCSHIVENNPEIKVTIISATYNTTNQLEMVAKTAQSGDEEMLNKVISEIETKHQQIANELFCSRGVFDELTKMITEIKEIGNKISHSKSSTSTIMDQLYSVGERMSSLIFADLLKLRMPKNEIVFFDARKVIKTNSDFSKAEPQIDLINEKTQLELIPLLNKPNTIVVTQGFIGQDLMGNTTTLGREGSDYSAALIGEAIDAQLIQIWTDVDGVASSDPRVISNVNYIEKLTYDEATAMATLGAKVLFPRTLLPAKRKGIPVFVGSSLNPLKRGTIIVSKLDESPQVKVVTGQKFDGVNYLSFIGCHLDKKVEIIDRLKQLLIQEHHSFSFFDFTSVSITFTFQELSINDALKIGHNLLSRI